MGADILAPYQPQHHDSIHSYGQSQYHLSLASPSYHTMNQPQFVNYMSRDFSFNAETLAVISREEIVENNFSQEFDALYTTFRPENKNIYGKFRILCSNITNERIQEYKMFFRNENDFRTYLVSYFWRKHNPEQKNWPLVRTTNLKVYEESKLMLEGGFSNLIRSKCSVSKEIYCRIYTEDIPLRLCHIKDIPFPENLYVMGQILKGFQIIYDSIGYIKPFEDLICITRKGHIKVWINSDLSKNFPNIENIDDNVTSSKSQSKLVNEILDIVFSCTDPSGEPLPFDVFLREQHVNLEFISFEKVLQMIQRYANHFLIQIPNVFGSIVQVLNQEEEEYDTYRTDIDNRNDEKVESSQPIMSQNRSGSGLFLDVPNTSSRMRINNNNAQKSKLSSKRQSGRKLEQKQKNKPHKTQSVKIGQNQRNSLEESIMGAKSNIILSESTPISRSLNQRPSSSNEIKPSGNLNNETLRQGRAVVPIQKVNERSFVRIERQSEASNNSIMIRDSRDHDQETRYAARVNEAMEKIVTEKVNGGSKIALNSEEKFDSKGLLRNSKSALNTSHQKFLSYQLPTPVQIAYAESNTPQISSQKNSVEPLYDSEEPQDPWAKIRSNNQIPLNNSRHPSEFLKNKKTYSNLFMERKYSDLNLLNAEDVEPSEHGTMVIKVEATEEEMQQMIEIDKFLEAEVMKEKQEQLRLSQVQMYPSRNQLMNKSQQLLNSSHKLMHVSDHTLKSPLDPLNKSQQLPRPKSTQKYTDDRMNKTIMPVPPTLKRKSSSRISSKHEDLSNQQLMTSRQQQMKMSSESGLYNEMHSSHHVMHLEHQTGEDQVLNSQIVQKTGWSNVNNAFQSSDLTKAAQLNELVYIEDREKVEGVISPPSKTSMNSHLIGAQLSFQPSPANIEIQPPSSSSRMNRNSEEAHTIHNESQKTSSNNLPHVVITTSSNHMFVPASQHQLSVHSGGGPQPTLVSSTSIGCSIMGPSGKQVNFLSNANTIVSPPFQSEVQRSPKVTFHTTSPQNHTNTNSNSLKSVSINQGNYSQQDLMKSPVYTGVLPLVLSNSSDSQNEYNPYGLSYRAKTLVSGYIHSQNGNSSRKYYEYDEISSFSKPSIVEFSLLRNPEYFSHGYAGLHNADTFHIQERSLEHSLEKIPAHSDKVVPEDKFSSTDDKNFSRQQNINHNHHYSYPSGPYEQHMGGIVPIPEETQAEMFNNSRSLVYNDEFNGAQSNSADSYGKNYYKQNNENSEEIAMVSSRQQNNAVNEHEKQLQGIRLSVSENYENTMNQVPQDYSRHRKESYLISEEFSHGLEEQVKSEEENKDVEFKINIRPSFESMSGCSQRENQPYSNKSYVTYSKKQSKGSFMSGQQKQNQRELVVGQRASHEGPNQNHQSRQNQQPKSSYRIVESIEENRPNSEYQKNVEALEKDDQIMLSAEENNRHKGKGHEKRQSGNHLNNLNQRKSQEGNHKFENSSQSPRESQNISPLGKNFHKAPVTGRTMFMNKENQLLSEFIDQESELESEVDYTYNSYDKWKDKSKVLDFGPGRFRQFDQRIEEERESTKKFNNIAFNYPERHGNHKKLVKSSIEGLKLLNHEFSMRDNFNTVQKEPDCNEEQEVNDEIANEILFETYSPEKRMERHRYRKSSEYKEETIDQDILNDLVEY